MPYKSVIRPKIKAARRTEQINAQPTAVNDCSVVITDIYKEAAAKILNMENELSDLKRQLASFDALVSQRTPLSCIIEPSLQPSRNQLASAGKFIDSIASEVNTRICRARNAIIFNVPDHLSLSTAKRVILNACDMKHYPFHCIRLRKKT